MLASLSRQCLVRIRAFSGLALLFLAGPLAAQTEPVVFVHGLGQSSGSWNAIIPDLVARHPLTPIATNTTSSTWYGVQATELRNQLNPYPSSLAAISHSNGGVVTREYVRTTASPRLNGHVSLGTPHTGAKLAQSLLNGSMAYWLGWVLLPSILDPVLYYRDEDWDWETLWFQGVSGWEAEYLAFDFEDFVNWTIPTGLSVSGYLLYDWGVFPQILPEMQPSSSFFNTLNASGALGTEAARLSRARVSITTYYPSYLAPFRAATSYLATPQLRHDAAIDSWLAYGDLQNFAWQAYWYYQGHTDWQLRNNAYRWLDMYYTMAQLTSQWQIWTGATSGPSDGIVPESAGNYPTSTSFKYNVSGLAVHHTEQLDAVTNHDQDAFRATLSEVIDVRLGLQEPPPPPPPLSVSMNGPSEVAPGVTCSWVASASGGNGSGSYTYQWSGVTSGSGANLSAAVYQQGMLTVTVSSGSQEATDQVYITVDEWAPNCLS